MNIRTKIIRRLKYYRNRWFVHSQTKRTNRTIVSSRNKNNIYLFCNPVHPNLGDQAQAMCILRWFAKYYPKCNVVCIPKQLSDSQTLDLVQAQIKSEDKVFVHSGYLTCEMYEYLPYICEVVCRFRNNPIVILPQTINIQTEEWRSRTREIYNNHPHLTLMCRDEISYKKAKEMYYCNVLLYPDFVTSLIGKEEFQYSHKHDGVLFIVRDDKEKLFTDEEIKSLKERFINDGQTVDQIDTTIEVSPFIWIKDREKTIKKYLQLISKYQVVITDRYHGTIFSQIVSVPTIVISSNDHKLSSGVKWFPKEEFGDSLFYADNLDVAYEIANKLLLQGVKPIVTDYFESNYWSQLCSKLGV